ncbi:MAG: MMPL family transporter [Sinobacterium sp.]|nr:MMPL family transporter [Sinobacterium sp.]
MPKTPSRRLPQMAFIICAVLAFVLATTSYVKRLTSDAPILDSNILNLLPGNANSPELKEALFYITDGASKRQFYLIGHDDEDVAKAWALKYQAALAPLQYVKEIAVKMDADQQRNWLEHLWNHRQGLVAKDTLSRLNQAGLPDQIDHAIRKIYEPFSVVNSELLEKDPLFIFTDFLQGLNAFQTSVSMEDGWLLVKDDATEKTYVFFQMEINESAFNINVQHELVPILDELRASFEEDTAGHLLTAGFLRHAAYGVELATKEISTIGAISLIASIFLLILTFRSGWPLLLTLSTLVLALYTAIGLSFWVFDEIFIITLVFATSLIGVAIDYCLHFFSEYYFSALHSDEAKTQGWNSKKISLHALNHIRPGLIVGLLSSLMAYVLLVFGGFPGMQQMAVVSALGLFFTCLYIFAFYPLLHRVLPSVEQGSKLKQPEVLRLINSYLRIVLRVKSLSPTVRYVFSGLVVAFIVIGVVRSESDDNIRQLQAMSPVWKPQDAELRERLNFELSPAFLALSASSPQALLELEEAIVPALNILSEEGAFKHFLATSTAMPSLAKQKADYALLSSRLQNSEAAFKGYLEELSFDLEQVQLSSFYEPSAYMQPNQAWLDLSPAVQQQWLGNLEGGSDSYFSVIQLAGLTDSTALRVLADNHDGVYWVNQAEDVSSLFSDFRQTASFLVSLALCFIVLAWSWRYGLNQSIAIMVAPVISIGMALAVVAYLGEPLNLFHILGLIIVLGMGADYSVFLLESKRLIEKNEADIQSLRATLIAITLSALTSCLSFGLLSLSATAAVHAFGISILIGIATAVLVSPLMLLDKATLNIMLNKE